MTTTDVPIHKWAVPNEVARKLVPETGWLHDYLEYAVWASDAPTMLHLGAALTTLCVAASKADIMVESDEQGWSTIPLVLWSLLIAPSGSRKSTAAKIPIEMLRRAVHTSKEWKEVVIPSDGSIEGWTTFLRDHNSAVLYRTEFSTVLSQSSRSYTSTLKPWLLELWESEDGYCRKTLSGGEIIINRPRVSILGPIPPKTFMKGVEHVDWSTGFLARITYWLGVRTHRNRLSLRNPATATSLTQWLQRVPCQTRGSIRISKKLMILADNWIVDNIEARRGKVEEDIFSHLDRYQSMIYTFASLYALSRQVVPQEDDNSAVIVEERDILLALELAGVLLISTLEFFKVSQAQHSESSLENAVIESIESYPDTSGADVEWIREDLQEKQVSLSRSALYRVLKSLVECGSLLKKRDLRNSCKIKYVSQKFMSKTPQ